MRGAFSCGNVRSMLKPTRALARLGASIKSSLLLGLDKVRRSQAVKAITDLKVAVHTMIAEKRTPGAFGSAMPGQRPGRRSKLMRANSAKVRGY